MSFRSAILDKWPYKLAAVVLSILLWLNVTADQQRQDQPMRTRVEFELSDTTWSIREAPAEVRTVFQGRQGDLIAMVNQPVLRKVIDIVTDSVMEVELRVEDVSFDRSLSVRPTAVVPQRVTLRLEPRVGRRVPVIARAGVRAAEGFVISRTVVQPDSVTLYGPDSVIERLLTVETAPLQLGEIRASTSRQADLVLPQDLVSVHVAPRTVLVSIEVDSLIARRIQVPVHAVGQGAEAVTLDPNRVWVTVTGAASAVESLTAADLVATVQVDVVPAEERTFEVAVQLPAGLSATRAVEPPRVRARRRAGVGDGGGTGGSPARAAPGETGAPPPTAS